MGDEELLSKLEESSKNIEKAEYQGLDADIITLHVGDNGIGKTAAATLLKHDYAIVETAPKDNWVFAEKIGVEEKEITETVRQIQFEG